MKAIVIGATGLIGQALIKLLNDDSRFTEIQIFSRKKIDGLSAKFKVIITDFTSLSDLQNEVKGDVLFSTLGTTLKTAGSKEKQYAIDYGIQYSFTEMAAKNQVSKFVLLSSAGANRKSKLFYPQMKGQLDEDVKNLGFKNISIIRPSMLKGNRKEFRLSEKIFTPIMTFFGVFPFIRKYRPIKDSIVAQAMINASIRNEESYHIYELEEVFELAK